MADMIKISALQAYEHEDSDHPFWHKVGEEYKRVDFMDWHTEGTTWVGGKLDVMVEGSKDLYLLDPYGDYLYYVDQKTCPHEWELHYNNDKIEHVCRVCWLHKDATAPGADIVTRQWNVVYSAYIAASQIELIVEKNEQAGKWVFLVRQDDNPFDTLHISEPIYDSPEQAMCAAEVWYEKAE